MDNQLMIKSAIAGGAVAVLGAWQLYKVLKTLIGEEKKQKIFRVREIEDLYQVDGVIAKYYIAEEVTEEDEIIAALERKFFYDLFNN